jgi:CBS domain-containing protein
MVKLAVKLSDEIGRNITQEDLIAERNVRDQMEREIVTIDEAVPMTNILNIFGENDFIIYPVVDDQHHFQGIISFENIKNIITNKDIWQWIVAKDLSSDPPVLFKEDMPLEDALETMKQTGLEQLPVVNEENVPVGILDLHRIERDLAKEIVTLKGNI